MPLLTTEMFVAEVLACTPSAGETLARHGMACLGCPMAAFETLGEAAAAYHLDGQSILREITEITRKRPAAPRARR